MADIKVTSTGRIFYRIDDATALLLLEAFPASFERLTQIEKKPLQTNWEYRVAQTGGGLRALARIRNTTVEYFTGPLEQIEQLWPECPASVASQFRAIRPSERAGGR